MNRFVFLLVLLFCGTTFADTITINWGVDNQPYTTTTCTVGGDVILPSVSKRGHVFRGWTPEHFNRGTFADWSSVPTSVGLYSADYHGARTPQKGDYITIEDAADCTGDYNNQIIINTSATGGGNYPAVTVEFFEQNTILRLNIGRDANTATARGQLKQGLYVDFSRLGFRDYRISFYQDSEYSQPTLVKINDTIGSSFNFGFDSGGLQIQTGKTIYMYYVASCGLSGRWRFVYDGGWETDGKAGWRPDYQISNE